MCAGGEGAGRLCPDSDTVECSACHYAWQPGDTDAPGKCPGCDSYSLTVRRCVSCPVEELNYVRAHSSAGRLFSRVLDLEFDIKHGSSVWDEMTVEETIGVRTLEDERSKAQQEFTKRDAENR